VAGASVGSFALRFRAKWLAVQPGIEIRQRKMSTPSDRWPETSILFRSYWAGPTGPVVLGMESR
jgi:hypothetical protein